MNFFSERKRLEEGYKQWLAENPTIADTPFNVISYLESIGRLKDGKENGWIPVDRRLPEVYGETNTSDTVLVQGYDKNLDYYWQAMGFYAAEPKQWFFAECKNTDKPIDWIDIIAWQPLPEDYKKEK